MGIWYPLVIYSWFTYSKWWFSIAMLNYQRVSLISPSSLPLNSFKPKTRWLQKSISLLRAPGEAGGRKPGISSILRWHLMPIHAWIYDDICIYAYIMIMDQTVFTFTLPLYITLHHFTSLYITLHHFTSLYITLHHIHHFTSLYIALHHFASLFITLHHFASPSSLCITSHHFTSLYITLHLSLSLSN